MRTPVCEHMQSQDRRCLPTLLGEYPRCAVHAPDAERVTWQCDLCNHKSKSARMRQHHEQKHA